ncbi:MAG TPA: CPBP family intramembrane glutamic endopeptidase [Thermoanaerobaculia bacterium]|nr:CPBP family intramembrane glutamic endopeptidase [Thermoanaerobaculia bacterium]
MNLDKLTRGDRRLLLACIAVAAVSLFVGVKYYFFAFPEASIEFRVTREGSVPLARAFLARLGLDAKGYRNAAIFGFDDEQKTFLERELGVAESNRLLESTVRLWRWKHRWFRPLQKEELDVEVTTKGEVVGFHHPLAEEAPGADLPVDEARRLAEAFLAGTMGRPLGSLAFVEASTQKRPHRGDHSFTWKVLGSEVHGADYRIAVDVAGAAVTGYDERLKVPDTWSRGYQELRSKNETASLVDSVFLLLTLLAMLGVLVVCIRRGDVRWRAAATLGVATFVLMSVSQLNSLPSELYDYDTTSSFGGFLVSKILLALAAGLGTGMVILVLAAAAEPMYRQRFPARLSLSSLLRPRALRTREFFVASLVGITLTCFFFAYENVFYIIANRLGAWAPREVAYSDLLSTAFPWVYVLFFGFLPAISEEFMSRMFSIPFFEKIFRSLALAVVVAAFIWGFGHAGYPNQPFWIRGLEVGLAGIVFGLAFLRFGIAAVVICHFSIDALYTAFVLIRSPSLYYQISGSLSAGIFVVLFLGAAIAYRVKGGFLPAEVTNEVEGVPPAPEPRAVADAAAAPLPAAAYRPLPATRIAWGLALAAALGALAFLPRERFGDWVAFHAKRDTARAAAAGFLRDAGFDVATYRRAVKLMDRTDPTAAAYLLQTGGPTAARQVYATLAPTPLWRVRFFVPGQKEEYWVSVDPTSRAAVGFTRTLLDDAPGERIPRERALLLAQDFLRARGVDPARGELKEQTEKDEKARRDHTLTWEFPVTGAGEAKLRQQVVVQGAAVGSWTREVKIPEQWRRQREKETAATVLFRWLKLPLLGAIGVLAVLLLIARIRAGEMPWRFAFILGGVVAAAVLVRTALSLDALWSAYDTSVPASRYAVVIAVSFVLAALGSFVGAALAGGLAGALHPGAVTMLRPAARRLFGRDALVGGAVALGLALGIPTLRQLVESLIPAGRLIDGVSWPAGIESQSPLVFALAKAVSTAIFIPAVAGIVAGVVVRHFRRASARALLAVLVVVSFLPRAARTPAEFAAVALSLAVLVAGVVLLVRCFLRDNPLAWVAAAWLGFGGAAAIRLLAEPAGAYRLDGGLLLAALLVVAAWLLLGSRAGAVTSSAESPPA